MNFSCENKGMASQVKKNKNQFIRKGIATSAVINTPQDVNTVDVSTIQSGVEKVQIGTPDVNSGVQSGVERVQIGTPDVNSGVQSGVERVQIGTPDVNSGVQSGVERVPIDIPNVNSGEINGSLRSIQKEEKLYTSYEQTATNSCTEVGGRSVMPEENFDPGGIMYNQYSSEYVPKLHSESCSKPSTGGISQSAIKNFSGQQTYDHVYNNHAPPLPKTPPPELPAKPPRMAKDETWGQHSSPANREVNQRSPALKKHHSSRLQKEYSPQFSNNLDDDGEENEDVIWEYPGEKKLTGHQMMASDIKYPKFKEHSQMHYGGEGILDNVKQGDQSSKAGHMLGGQYGQQTGQIPCGHLGGQMPGVLYMGNMGNMHQFGRNSGYTPSWQEEGYSGQLQDGQHSGPVPTRHFAGTMKPVPTGHLAGTVEPVPTRNLAGTMGPVPTKHYAGSMRPGPNRNHAGTIGQMPYQLNEGSMQQMHESSVGQMHGSSVGQMYGGSLGPLHGDYVGQMHGGLHGGSVGQMHPHAQSEVMHPFGQGYLEEFQDVHHEQDDMGQPWDFPKETWQGDGKGNASYSQHASNFPGPSTYMTDRELASGQLDQRMNNPWFQKVVQNMKELVEREGLIVKDVFPDGNCLFTAVVDQLRVRGNFNFTPSTLRAAAVAFLRENPKQHDGTHLEQFLMNESWDHYLGRMCKDGEWGEHIILGAMSEVLKCRIIVLGGMSGNSRTVVQPQRMYDEEEKKMQKEKEEANGSKTVKDESLAGTAKSEVTGAESQSLQTGAASSTSKADAKTKGTDTSHRKVKTSSLSKQNKTKKDEELQMGEDLYIGLVGEMHYVSLRKKDWEERLNEKLRARIQKRKAKQRQEAGQRDDSLSDDDLCLPEDLVRKALKTKERRGQKGNTIADNGFWTDMSATGTDHDDVALPNLHLGFLVNYIFNSKYILSKDEGRFEDCSNELFSAQMFGIEFLPAHVRYPIYSSNRLSLDSRTDNDYKERKFTGVYAYCIPGDTRVVSEGSINMASCDLVLHERKSHPGFTRLIPTTPFLWYPAIVSDNDGNIYLKHLHCKIGKTSSIDNDTREGLLISFRSRWSAITTEWRFRQRSVMWPNSDIVEQVAALDTFIIPRGPNISTSSSDIEWEISFAPHEKFIMATAVTRSQKLCFLLMRLLVDPRQDRLNEDYLEILKTVFFYACETIPVSTWDLEPVLCLVYMFSRIRYHLEARALPHYFMSSRNILQDLTDKRIDILIEQIEILHIYPLFSLYSFCDEVGLCCLQPGRFLDDIFEALFSSADEYDLKIAFVDTFCPKVIEMSQRMVEKGLYDSASAMLASFPRIEDVMGAVSSAVQITNMLRRLSDIDRWCLAFCMDRITGLPSAEYMFSSFAQSKLSELIGPVVERCIGEVMIPTKFTDLNIVCKFVYKFASILCSVASDEVAVEGMKFFLQKYQRSVCELIVNMERQASSSSMDNTLYQQTNARLKSQTMQLALLQVHTQLFTICVRNGYVHHLIDVLNYLENSAEAMCSKVVYEMLARSFKVLGNEDKMNLYQAHADSIVYTDDPAKTLQF